MNANSARKCKRVLFVMVLFVIGLMLSGLGANAADYYTEPQVFGMRPNPRGEVEMGPIGATGIEGRIYKGVKVTVEETVPNTPAHGKFSRGRQKPSLYPLLRGGTQVKMKLPVLPPKALVAALWTRGEGSYGSPPAQTYARRNRFAIGVVAVR